VGQNKTNSKQTEFIRLIVYISILYRKHAMIFICRLVFVPL